MQLPSTPTPDPPGTGPPQRADRLTIFRLLLLTAGIAVALAFFPPDTEWTNSAFWRQLWGSILIGLSLPAPLILLFKRKPGQPHGLGGMVWLAFGLGAWTMLPPAVAMSFPRRDSFGLSPSMCLHLALPLAGLWTAMAISISGRFRAEFAATQPWSSRMGIWVILGWSPLGVWLLYDVYKGAFGW
jgi:hypothetical protein